MCRLRQYLYHPRWREKRDQAKHDHVLDFAVALPELGEIISRDLAGRVLTRERVLAAAVRLLDLGFFRVGGERYAEDNGTYGLATLHREHVSMSRAGLDVSAKDFRTWNATVLAAVGLAVSPVPRRSASSRKRAIARVVKEVSAYLGNTPAVRRLAGAARAVVLRAGRRLPADGVDRPGEQPVQRRPLVQAQRAEQVVLDPARPTLGQAQRFLPPRRQLDDMAAAVGGIAAAGDQPPLLELVEQPDDVARVQAQRLREPLLAGRPVLAEQLQRDEVPGAKAARRHRGLGGAPPDAGEVVEQGQRLLLNPLFHLRHSKRLHPMSIICVSLMICAIPSIHEPPPAYRLVPAHRGIPQPPAVRLLRRALAGPAPGRSRHLPGPGRGPGAAPGSRRLLGPVRPRRRPHSGAGRGQRGDREAGR